ncbi:hypothetical protein D8674_021257 [Pyrus ussuriensis x Pyrus communis]|uniref:PHD-type domain-containing protein n=1 Tax=Pyrus ussuriensis x Pyrus communis TaxID=2448454 RepID=A0A5N5GGP3_9ROSA|nr:hypothetical protein D8674_021257 [Pyrus ussuriensis x Pyrus communis]
MAKGTDAEEFVVMSKVRAGLKREFAFALKAQAEISGSLGRTRGSRAQNGDCKRMRTEAKTEERSRGDGDEKLGSGEMGEGENVNVKEELEEAMSEEDAKSDVVDVMSDDEPKFHVGESVPSERIGEDELKHGVVEMAVYDEPQTGYIGDSEPEKPLVDEEVPVLIENSNVKVEVEVSEKPPRRFTRSALKLEAEKLQNLPAEGCTKEMAVDDEPQTGCIGDSEPEKPMVDEEVPVLVENRNVKVEEEVIEKPPRRFTRSALKLDAEKMQNLPAEGCTDQIDSGIQKSPFVTPMKIDTKMPNMVRKFSKLKELLDTGILEGQPVKYLRGSKVRESGETGLRGVIRGSSILCHCDSCKGTEVITPPVFELHAGSSNKFPSDHIYLENGKTLRDVMIVCENSPLEALEEAVRLVIGCSSISKCTICLNCKESINKDCTRSAVLLCSSCMELKESGARPAVGAKQSDKSSKPVTGPNSPDTLSKCSSPEQVTVPKHPYMPKGSSSMPVKVQKHPHNVPKCRSSESKSQGRVTKKDLRLHKLVFEEDCLLDGTEVGYFSKGKKMLVGYKKGPGIVCGCCNDEVSASTFEAHAGFKSRRKPYMNIYTSNGVSLHELALSLSSRRKWSTKHNDDLCSICEAGGDLLCCDNCPRAFHKEKYVEHNPNAVAAGRVAGVDPIEQITNRCIRIVTTFDEKLGGCALCSSHEFSGLDFGPGTVILCDQCEKEYHVGCLKDKGIEDMKELPKDKWFCCSDCLRVHSALQKLVAHGEQKLPDSLLNVVRKKHNKKGPESGANLDIKWRVLNGKMSTDDESVQLLSNALEIFHDRFSPIIDPTSRQDFIKEMLYGRTIQTQDFGGMYCGIITVNQLVVSAGMFRIYGAEVAELPLVATCADLEGQGYFQILFSCIERLLAFLNVKSLVLPAASEAESIWKNRFGFEKLTQNEIHDYRKSYQMMIFQGTNMLRKPVPKCRILRSHISN